ncbi:MAG: DUF3857 domain-containing protein, partial [Acidobacteria bacterium]|nr:DUF3857 domain-containing protein [Acidobacteriota bacterium]
MRARILSLFILMLGLSVMAGSIDMKEWAPIPEADLQLTDNPKEPGAKAMLLFKHACRDMYEYCEHGAVKIFNQAGNDLADFSLPEDVKDIRARTIKPDGTWVELDKDSIRKRLVYKRKRQSMKQKVFSFEGVEPGVVLEYKYKYRLSDRERFVYVWPFQTDLFCREAWLDLDEKMIRNYNRMIIDTYFQAGVISYPKDGHIRYEATNIPALPDEDFLPPKLETSAFFIMHLGMPAVDGARSLDLTSESGKEEYIKLFWQDYGEKWAKNFAKFMKPGKEVRNLLDTIRQSDARDLPIERKIYGHVVANFENLSYQTEPDSATADKKAKRKYKDRNNVADVIKLGYGGKGELTQLYVALLQEAGLDARLAYVCGRDESFFRNYLLVDQFDEPLAVIKTADGMVCLDPGTPYCDYGVVNWNKEGVKGMFFSRDDGEMFTTPVAPAGTNVIERVTRVQFTDEGITGQIT